MRKVDRRRTAGQEIDDTLRELDTVIAQAKQAQKHLLRARRHTNDPGIAHQARRSIDIVQASAEAARFHATELVVMSEAEFQRDLVAG